MTSEIPPVVGAEDAATAPVPPVSSATFEPLVAPVSATEPDRSPGWPRKVAAVCLVCALSLGSGYAGARLSDADGTAGAAPIRASAASATLASNDIPTQSFAKVAAAVQPSVVSITVKTARSTSEGSGVVLRADGTIVTNNHVVASAANNGTIVVKFADGKTASATIVGRDATSDLAVIKVDGVDGLTPAVLGTSASLHVGDTLLALGSPLGLDGSVSAGIVSALHRTVDLSADTEQDPFGRSSATGTSRASVGDAIQTDAAINPGNSGGPLVDVNGAVVGINTAIASTGSGNGSIGVGFAIPVEEMISVTNQLINGEVPKHAVLGVQIDDSADGALLASVTAGGAAEAAGLKAGDLVTKVGSTSIEDGTSLAAIIRSHQPGDKVSITYTRGESTKSVEVTLGSAS